MNANPKFLNATAHVDEAAVKPLPNSRKVYVEGSRPDIRVPMRKITQSDTPAAFGAEKSSCRPRIARLLSSTWKSRWAMARRCSSRSSKRGWSRSLR